MPRRSTVSGLLAATLLTAAPPPAGAAAPSAAAVAIGGPAGPRVPTDFLGLAVESQSALAYAAPSGRADPALDQLVRNLAPGGRPVVRVGGHTSDQSYVVGPGIRPSPGLRIRLGDRYLAALRRFARDVDAQLMLGVNLEAGDAALARAETLAFQRQIGSRYLRSIELGNEPSLYSAYAWYRDAHRRRVFSRGRDWSVTQWLAQYRTVSRGLPDVPLVGPDLGDFEWMSQIGGLLRTEPRIAEVTFHTYLGNACGPSGTPVSPTVPNLLSPFGSRAILVAAQRFERIARAHGRPFRIDEFNSFSCGGRFGVSDTFASALWELDALFGLLSIGVDGVNVQTFPGAAYQLFSAVPAGERPGAIVYPDYYGLLMFAAAAPAGSRLLTAATPAGSDGWLRAWATRGTDGTLRVLLLNDSPTRTHLVHLALPRADTGLGGTVVRMTAPSVDSRAGVAIGGQSLATPTVSGLFTAPPQATALTEREGIAAVTLPPGSAALVSIARAGPAPLERRPLGDPSLRGADATAWPVGGPLAGDPTPARPQSAAGCSLFRAPPTTFTPPSCR